MRAWVPLTWAAAGAVGLFFGCGGDTGNNCTAGTLFCLCFQNTCQVGLVCVDNYCLSPNDAETSGNGDGDGDGDGDTSPGDGDGDTGPGDGDGDTGPGDGDGDTGPGDGDGDGDLDSDNDTVPNNQDNCPFDPNPNQLDFDGNGQGNVCDVLTFTSLSGSLSTNVALDAGIGGTCQVPATWTVTGGEVRVELDDDASQARFEITELLLANYNANNCALVVPASMAFTNASVDNTAGPFPVTVSHSLAAHNNGTIGGSSNVPHPISYMSDIALTLQGMPGGSSAMQLGGELFTFSAAVSGGGASGTLTWSTPNSPLTDIDTFMLQGQFPVDVDIQFIGLSGSLNLAP